MLRTSNKRRLGWARRILLQQTANTHQASCRTRLLPACSASNTRSLSAAIRRKSHRKGEAYLADSAVTFNQATDSIRPLGFIAPVSVNAVARAAANPISNPFKDLALEMSGGAFKDLAKELRASRKKKLGNFNAVPTYYPPS